MDNNNKRRALGRGLEELFNNEPIDYNKVEEKILETTPKEEILEINLNELRSNPYQPRQIFDTEKLEELAASIKQYGVVQPIIIKKSIKGYEIVAGERRVKAAELAGLSTIPAIVRDFSDAEMMEIALLENLQRENLNPIEEAEAYQKIKDSLQITQEELGRRFGKSRTYITNTIGLLSLPEMVKTFLAQDKISMAHAKILSKIEDTEKVLDLANRIITEHISVRELEDIITKGEFQKKNPIQKLPRTNEYKYAEESLFDKFGTKVKIKNKKILISFENDNDLNRILEIIGISNN